MKNNRLAVKDVQNYLEKKKHLELISYQPRTKEPTLVILSRLSDQYLNVQGALRLVVSESSESGLVGVLQSALHGQDIDEIKSLANLEVDLAPLLKELNDKRWKICHGYLDHPDYDSPFPLVRKTDLGGILRERYSGNVVFRSIDCKSVLKNETENVRQCEACKKLFDELDTKYCGRRFFKQRQGLSELESDKDSEEKDDLAGVPRKKARRSVRKKDPDHISPDEALRKVDPSSSLVEKEETDNQKNLKDVDFKPRRGVRERKRFNDIIQNIATSKGKRGRPPTIMKPKPCEICGEVFVLARDYKYHKMSHKESHKCSFENCPKVFKSKMCLDIHERRHRGEHPFFCKECDKKVANKVELKNHIREHTDGRPYECPHCEKRFKRAQQRDVHIAVHTGEKPHLCPECGNSFGSASTLIDHRKRKHLEVRDFKCEDCQKAFFTKQELESHVRTHSGLKPFVCTQCGKSFSRGHHLKRHMVSVHQASKTKIKLESSSEDTNLEQPMLTNNIKVEEGDVIEGDGIIQIHESDAMFVTGMNTDDQEEENTTLIIGEDPSEIVVNGQRYTSTVTSDGTRILIQKFPDSTSEEHTQEAMSGEAATSLIELSQERTSQTKSHSHQDGKQHDENERQGGKENAETGDSEETLVVEIPSSSNGRTAGEHQSATTKENDEDDTQPRYMLLTTDEDGSQKLVPVSTIEEVTVQQEEEDQADSKNDKSQEE